MTVALATVLATGAGVAVASLAKAKEFSFPAFARTTPKHKAITVYLHRGGGVVKAGVDNPAMRRSGVLDRNGMDSVTIPRYGGGTARWNQLVRCVEAQYADFDVTIVDEEPRGGDYVLAMVGGSPEQFGLEKTVGGVAPHNNGVIADAVVFVFETPHRSVQTLCETTAHEIGHAFGLDHSRACNDVMSYESCGPKTFQERTHACGEWSDRQCSNGVYGQNSWHQLAEAIGLRKTPIESEPVAKPKAPPVKQPARLAVAASTPRANATYTVKVDASDPDGISKVDILWYDQRARLLRCGQKNANRPFTCSRRGSEYTFKIPVKTGRRKFVVRITDGKGNVRRTTTYAPRFK